MRIGLAVYGSLDAVSGGYLYDRLLVQYLRGQGDTIGVFSLPERPYALSVLQNFSARFLKRVADFQPDVLIEDGLCHPSLFALNRKLRACSRLVGLIHLLKSFAQSRERSVPLYRALESAFLNSVDGCIFNSCVTRNHAQALAGRPLKGVVAYPAGNHLGPGLTPEAIRARAAAAGPLRLLFPGNVIARKGLPLVLEALTLLPPESCLLTVAGRLDMEPGHVRRVQHLTERHGLSNRVVFLGEVPGEAMTRLYAQSDLVVLPSTYEGYGIAYVEGFACGLPPIGTTGGAAREIITDGETGILIEPGDAGGLARHLHALYRDRGRLLSLSLKAREAFERHPGWENSFERLRGFLLEMTH